MPDLYRSYGGKSLHAQSHGESFFGAFLHRFGGQGLYILDEPEAALGLTKIIEIPGIHRYDLILIICLLAQAGMFRWGHDPDAAVAFFCADRIFHLGRGEYLDLSRRLDVSGTGKGVEARPYRQAQLLVSACRH